MNRAARQHLIACMTARAAPWFVVTVRPQPEVSEETIRSVAENLAAVGFTQLGRAEVRDIVGRLAFNQPIVLPADTRIEWVDPGVRVVAGKGRRRRGVTGRAAAPAWRTRTITSAVDRPSGRRMHGILGLERRTT